MKPQRIFLVRHGQSIGNVNKKNYNIIPDYAIALTEKGIEQAKEAGRQLKQIIGDETVGLISSPYYRARDTAKYMRESLDPIAFYEEDPRLREHEFTAQLIDTDKEKWEQVCDEFSVFYYRFTTGESGADTYDRQCTLKIDLEKEFERSDYPTNLVISGHGMTNRIFLMRWLKMRVEEFECLKNPRNGEFFQLNLLGDKYVLDKEPRKRDKGRRLW
jgi:broad specificity phosphatase PhoE